MSNVRYNILENLKTALEGITKANGYQTDIVMVSRKFQGWEGLTSEKFPALFVLDDGREEVQSEEGGWVFANMYPAIIGYVKEKEDLSLAFGKLDADMKKFLYSNLNLGDNCKAVIYMGYDVIFTMSDELIIFQLRPQIIYDFPKADP